MNKPSQFFYLTFCFLILSFFTSCTLIGNLIPGGTTPPLDPGAGNRNGEGLEVDFSLSKGDHLAGDEFIYELQIENSGKDPITLSRDNFKLSTIQKVGSDGSYTSVFDKESLEKSFYSNIFEESSLTLQKGDEISKKGVIKVNEEYFENENNQGLDYRLFIEYEYTTYFVINLRVSKESSQIEVIPTDGLSQAAPIQVRDFKYRVSSDGEKRVFYSLKDISGYSHSGEAGSIPIPIDSISFNSEGLQNSNCIKSVESKDFLVKVQDEEWKFTRNYKTLVYDCHIEVNEGISEGSSYTTQTSGSFDYVYKILESGEIEFPKERSIYALE